MVQIRLVAADPHDVGLEIVGLSNHFECDNRMNVLGGVEFTRQREIPRSEACRLRRGTRVAEADGNQSITSSAIHTYYELPSIRRR